jgi:poly-gamma-glutamate capsule biosynthesis protein CapA/YwtB (metallophosphatase superfamily)
LLKQRVGFTCLIEQVQRRAALNHCAFMNTSRCSIRAGSSPLTGARPAKTDHPTRLCLALLFATLVPGLAMSAQTAGLHPPLAGEIHIVAVGDIMLGGESDLEQATRGFDHPFVQVADVLRSADVAIGNLEGPLTTRGSVVLLKRYTFRSPPEPTAAALARAGFDFVSLANNHILDYGTTGLDDSIAGLDRAGIRHAGGGINLDDARRPAILDVRGTRIALLAYSFIYPDFAASATRPGTAFISEELVCADIRAARAQSDVVMVSFHWGKQWAHQVLPDQRRLGHAAIDAGATAIFGHHPHVLQGMESYRGGIIFYSLGNFTFGLRNKRVTRSAIAELRLKGNRVAGIALQPINVDNTEIGFQPRLLSGPAASEVVEQLRRLSASLDTLLENRNGKATLSLEGELPPSRSHLSAQTR